MPSKHKTFVALAQRLRRWSNIVQMLYKCFVFAGHTPYKMYTVVTYIPICLNTIFTLYINYMPSYH